MSCRLVGKPIALIGTPIIEREDGFEVIEIRVRIAEILIVSDPPSAFDDE